MPAVSDYGIPQDKVESAPVDAPAVGKLTDESLPSSDVAGALTSLPADAAAELAKWRARVPKLAAALKQRTSQVESLQAQLAELMLGSSDAPTTVDAGIRARQQQLDELERKYAALNQRYQQAAGEIRSGEVALEEVREEALSWKVSWQEVTHSLDEQCDLVRQSQQLSNDVSAQLVELQTKVDAQEQELADRSRRLPELETQVANAESRNANLLESVELANRQIETLGEDLGGLQEKRIAGERRVAELLENQTELQNQLVERRGRVIELQEKLSTLEQQVLLGNQAKAAFQAQFEAQRQQTLLETAEIQAEHSQQLRDVHAQTVLVFEAVNEQWAVETESLAVALQDQLTLANQRFDSLNTTRNDEATAQRFALAANVVSLEAMLETQVVAVADDEQDADDVEAFAQEVADAESVQLIENLQQEVQALQRRLDECLLRPFQSHALTRLKGVGEKTAEQLCELGFDTLQTIAQLKRDVLSSPIHPLHALRGRILHDAWIEQAQNILQNESAQG